MMNQSTAHRSSRLPEPVEKDRDRVAEAFDNARRHSRRVRALKLGLPIIAVLLMGAFVARTFLIPSDDLGFSVESTAIEGGRLVMSEPKLDGFTVEGRAYSMTARRAVQDIGSASQIDLEGIVANLPIDADSSAKVEAASGKLDRDANTLDIDSEMVVTTDDGMTARFASARIDMSSGALETGDPVEISLDGTRIAADSMKIEENGAVLVFENRVRVEMDGNRLQTAAQANGVSNEN